MNYRNITRVLVSIVVGAIHESPLREYIPAITATIHGIIVIALSLPNVVHRFKISIIKRYSGRDCTQNNGRSQNQFVGAIHESPLREYDYSQAGAYFITVCTQNRKCLFGDIADDQMVLNDAGKMIRTVWGELPKYYPGVGVDCRRGVLQYAPTPNHKFVEARHYRHCAGPALADMSLPDVIHRFKSLFQSRS